MAQAQKRRPVTLAQSDALERQLTMAKAVAPTVQNGDKIQYKKRHSDSVSITGTTDQFLVTSGLTLASGRFMSPTEVEGGRPVCVIGSQVATNLFLREDPVGNKVTIGGRTFEVVGVLEKQGSFVDSSIDNQAIVPLKQFTTFMWSYPDYEVQVKIKEIAQLEDAKEELRSVMRKVRHLAPNEPDDFAINQQDQIWVCFIAWPDHRGDWPVYHRAITVCRRHWYHEHHVRLSRRADARDWCSQSDWRQATNHPRAILN